MWSLVARMLVVFAAWGAVLAGALWAGMGERTAELVCAAGAGTTLLALGLAPRRRRTVVPEAPETADAERERASV